MKLLLCVVLAIALPGVCAGQSTSPSEPTLQAILSELRAIHEDMRVETARTQSMELLLAELQIQAATVTRAIERADAARSRTMDVQAGIRNQTAAIPRMEQARDAATSESDKRNFTDQIDRIKDGLSSLKKMEQDRLSEQQEAEAALQKAHNAYDAIEDQLSAIVKTLHTAQEAGNK